MNQVKIDKQATKYPKTESNRECNQIKSCVERICGKQMESYGNEMELCGYGMESCENRMESHGNQMEPYGNRMESWENRMEVKTNLKNQIHHKIKMKS